MQSFGDTRTVQACPSIINYFNETVKKILILCVLLVSAVTVQEAKNREQAGSSTVDPFPWFHTDIHCRRSARRRSCRRSRCRRRAARQPERSAPPSMCSKSRRTPQKQLALRLLLRSAWRTGAPDADYQRIMVAGREDGKHAGVGRRRRGPGEDGERTHMNRLRRRKGHICKY